VVVIRHEHPGEESPLACSDDGREEIEEVAAVAVIEEDRTLFDPAIRHMPEGAGEFEPERASHRTARGDAEANRACEAAASYLGVGRQAVSSFDLTPESEQLADL
jgi:hypothetical protein